MLSKKMGIQRCRGQTGLSGRDQKRAHPVPRGLNTRARGQRLCGEAQRRESAVAGAGKAGADS